VEKEIDYLDNIKIYYQMIIISKLNFKNRMINLNWKKSNLETHFIRLRIIPIKKERANLINEDLFNN